MEPIDVNVNIENPEFPTRVRIIDLDGEFEHAEAYSTPKYTFSVKVEIKYNKVVDGKEKNLITCTFWTNEDYAPFSFEEDDLCEDEVEEWFLEGLHDDLSFHNMEGLEDLDFYALGVPVNENDECGKDIEDFITEAFDECISEIYEDFDCKCSTLYKQPVEAIQFEKELVTTNGDCKTVWSIEEFDYDRDYYDDGNINASYNVKCSVYIKDELFYSFEYQTEESYLMSACPNLYANVVKEIQTSEFSELVSIEPDMSNFCGDFEHYVIIREENDSFEDGIKEFVMDELEYDEDEEIIVTLGSAAKTMADDYDQMSDLQRKSFTYDFKQESDQVIETLYKYQQQIQKMVEEDPDDEYEKDIQDVLDYELYAFGLYYNEGVYYICFGDICGQELEYEECGEKSEKPFTKEEIKQYVEGIYYQMLT